MSDLLNQASLVMVPSGYKEDTVYSVVPSDGSGDLSFTRASNGTRVNSAGLVEVVAWNLASYSEDFTNGWPVTATITANTTTNPINGQTNADTITGTGYVGQNIASVGVNTFFVYAKANSASVIRLNVYDGATDRGADYNLTTGAISGAYGSPISTNAESVGNGWWKISITTNNASYSNVQIHRDSTGTCYIYGAQLNIGSTAKPYFPTTDRLNVPRLTYQNGGGGCPSLLLEKQSTNLVEYSQDFTQWSIIRASLGANTTAPNGVNDGYSIIANTTNDDHFVLQSVSVVNTTVYSYTAFLKKGNKSWARLWNTSVGYADFDLENGVVGTQSGAVGSIQSFGNGWYRCSIVYTANSTGINSHRIYTLNGDGDKSFAGDGSTINLYMFGAQLEASSYPTSYIPTTSSSATRVADACSKTGISSLIGQTEGVIFFDGYFGNETDEMYAFIQNSLGSSTTSSMYLIKSSSGIKFQSYDSSTTLQWEIQGGSYTIGQRIKIAGAYKANDIVLYVNGVQIGTDTSATIPTCTALQIGVYPASPTANFQYNGKVNQAILFPTRLTNAELASLTTI